MHRSAKGSYFAAAGFIILMIIFAVFHPGVDLALSRENASYINDNWLVRWQENGVDESMLVSALPVDLSIPIDTAYSIEKTIAADFFEYGDKPAVGIRSSLQHISVTVDNIIIYEVDFDSSNQIVMPLASTWHIVRLPENSLGKVLSINLRSPFESMSGTINQIMIGTPEQIHNEIRSHYLFRFYFALLIFIIGLVIILFDTLIKSKAFVGFVNLGFFAIFLSLWILAESRMIQFIIGNQWIIGSLAYLTLAIFPMPLLFYIRDHIVTSTLIKKTYSFLVLLFAINLILISILQVTGVRGFFDSLVFTHILIGSGILLIIVTLMFETVRHDNIRSRRFLLHISILIIFGLIEQVNFIQQNFETTSVFVLTGITIFLIMQSVFMARQITSILKKSYQAEAFEMLAFIDPLTKGKNRMAFERDLDDYFHQAQENAKKSESKDTSNISADHVKKTYNANSNIEKKLHLIFFDFDGLKAINDTMGHHHGDDAIQNGYNLINQQFSEFGKCYRIGGDEFACIALIANDISLYKTVKHFEKAVSEFSNELPYELSISVGLTAFDETNDTKPGDIMRRADQIMYQHKQHRKNNKLSMASTQK